MEPLAGVVRLPPGPPRPPAPPVAPPGGADNPGSGRPWTAHRVRRRGFPREVRQGIRQVTWPTRRGTVRAAGLCLAVVTLVSALVTGGEVLAGHVVALAVR